MANKSTTIPIKLAVNRARPESIRKITQSYRVFPFLQPSTRSVVDRVRTIDPSTANLIRPFNVHSSLRARKDRSARYVAFLWMEKLVRNYDEVKCDELIFDQIYFEMNFEKKNRNVWREFC